jgi:predicted alpha/beta-hydrolase family hydrolase
VTVFREASVAGFLHQPETPSGKGLVLTHGAGGNCKAPLLVKLADALCAAGYCVLRCDMAFRQHKPYGPPSPATSASDRASLREAVAAMRKLVPGAVLLGGHSYGGRQSSMLAAENHGLIEGLLLLSYPLHAPGKPAQPRTAHFPALQTPALFVHGTKDPFGTIEELTEAMRLIPAKTELITVTGAGHDLKRDKFDLVGDLIEKLGALTAAQPEHHA